MKKVKAFAKRYFVTATGAMAFGLMATLVVGVYFTQLASIPALSFLGPIAEHAAAKSAVIGAAIGVAIAHALGRKSLVIYANAVVGAIGYMAGDGVGGPVGAFVGAVVGAEIGGLVAGRTKLDIVLTPFVTILSGGIIGNIAGPYVGLLMVQLGNLINAATAMEPFFMGIVVSVIMGMTLTSPISSAALAISLGLSGLAGGAATIGCVCNMVGFAIISYRDNGLDGLVAQALGTSKIQLPNVLRKPIIWVPAILSSAILGPVSTIVFQMANNKIGAGMGSSALVGQINTFIEMSANGIAPIAIIVQIALMHFILPAGLTYLFYRLMHRKGLIKDGDMKLPQIQ